MHDPFSDHIPGQRLPPGALLRCLWWLLFVVLLLVSTRLGVFCIRFRLAGLPERFEQCQLLFGELLALAIALGVEKFAQQTAVFVLLGTFVLEPFAQFYNDLLQQVDVFRQAVGIHGRHSACFHNTRKTACFQERTNESEMFYAALRRYRLRLVTCSMSMPLSNAPSSSVVISI